MRASTIFTFSVLAATAAAATAQQAREVLQVLKRQTQTCADFSLSDCGIDSCYDPATSVCCESTGNYCPLDSYCTVGDDGEPACCDNGYICTGDGGVSTSELGSGSSTSRASSGLGSATATTTGSLTTTRSTTTARRTTTSEVDTESFTTTTRATTANVLPATTSRTSSTTTPTPNAAVTAYANIGAAAGFLALHMLV